MLRNVIMLLCSLTLALPAMALKEDTTQPISIDAATQSVDMQKNKITFTGNVVIKQGSIEVYADRVVVLRQENQSGNELIEAFGQPVHFSQKQDNGKTINGSGEKLSYELKTEQVVLQGNAQLNQEGSSINSPIITYLVKQQRMEANSANQQRVLTILEPSQLRDNKPVH